MINESVYVPALGRRIPGKRWFMGYCIDFDGRIYDRFDGLHPNPIRTVGHGIYLELLRIHREGIGAPP